MSADAGSLFSVPVWSITYLPKAHHRDTEAQRNRIAGQLIICFWKCAAYAFTASTSKVIETSSPTRMPPVSSAAFHVRPKSLRLILVVAVQPILVLPHGSLA